MPKACRRCGARMVAGKRCAKCKRRQAGACYRRKKASPAWRAAIAAAAVRSRGRSPRNFLATLLRSGASRREELGSTISLAFLLEQLERQGGECFYSGVPMTWTTGAGRVDTNISIDRLDAAGPYEPSNVVLCCYFINVSKREKTIEEWLAWADRVAVRRARHAA